MSHAALVVAGCRLIGLWNCVTSLCHVDNVHPHLLPWNNHLQRMLIIPRCAVQALFDAILAGLLARVRDHNGRVQEAACSGLAEVLEHAGHCTQGAILVPRFQVGWCGWGGSQVVPVQRFRVEADVEAKGLGQKCDLRCVGSALGLQLRPWMAPKLQGARGAGGGAGAPGLCTQGAILVPRFQVRDLGLFITLDYMFVSSMHNVHSCLSALAWTGLSRLGLGCTQGCLLAGGCGAWHSGHILVAFQRILWDVHN
jgi:hypothetical protein